MRNIIETEYLASMLAENSISVRFSDTAKTASFSTDTRELVMPAFAGMDGSLFDLLLAHEVGHAIFSPSIPPNVSPIEHAYLNILEDVRIDRKQRERYAGLKKDYFFGSKKMLEENIFDLDDSFAELAVIDKINLHSKIGMHKKIPFTVTEHNFLKRAYTTETFEDVVTLAREIMEYERAKEKEQEKQEQEKQSESGKNNMPGEDKEDQEKQESAGETETGAGENQEQENPDNTYTEGDDDIIEDEGEAVEYENIPAPITSDKLNNFVSQYKTDVSCQDTITIGNVNYKPFFADGKAFRENMFELFQTKKDALQRYDCDFYKWQELVKKDMVGIKSAVSLLVRQFEMKKRAKANVSLTANKGELDVNKLSLYKITDDIFFTRIQEQVQATKHKIVMLLDCSGSMNSGGFYAVADKIAVLRGFCKTVNVPFEIIGFSSYYNSSKTVQYQEMLASKEITRHHSSEECAAFNAEQGSKIKGFPPNGICLLNILNNTDSDEYFARLYYTLKHYNSILTFCRWWRNDTPLNYAVNLCYSYLRDMKLQSPDTKLNFIVLTDGESSDYLYWKSIVRLNGREYSVYSYAEDGADIFDYQYVIYKALKEQGIVNSVVKYHVVYSSRHLSLHRQRFLLTDDESTAFEPILRQKTFILYKPIDEKTKTCVDKIYFLLNKSICPVEPYRMGDDDLTKRYMKAVKTHFTDTLNKSGVNKAIANDIVDFLI